MEILKKLYIYNDGFSSEAAAIVLISKTGHNPKNDRIQTMVIFYCFLCIFWLYDIFITFKQQITCLGSVLVNAKKF